MGYDTHGKTDTVRQIRRETQEKGLYKEEGYTRRGLKAHMETVHTWRDIVTYGGRLVEIVRATNTRRRFTLRTETIYRPENTCEETNAEGFYTQGDTHRKTNTERGRGTYG